MTNMIVGWASARFGILGQPKADVPHGDLNYAGVFVAVIAMVFFAFIKPSVDGGNGAKSAGDILEDEHDAQYAGLYAGSAGDSFNKSLTGGYDAVEGGEAGAPEGEEATWTDKLSPAQKTIFGFGASIFSGLLYGVNFNPPGYVAAHACPAGADITDTCLYPGLSSDLKDYIFSHFIGIWLMSTLVMVCYCVSTKNTPQIFAEAVAPGVLSGMIWATAQVSWFFANSLLGNVIAFPIISVGPGLVSALWGIFVFRELQGVKNYSLVATAFVFIAAAATMMALSDQA
jgi:hypothetical protein